jgi:tetratricopeptide (TPR) repeat protein
MAQNDSQSKATETVPPPKSGTTPGFRDLTFAGVTVVLTVALTAGVTCSVAYHFITDSIANGWHWKPSAGSGIDTSFADETDVDGPFIFKKVDLVELNDSLHLMTATQGLFNMDYGRALAEIEAVSPERRKVDESSTTLEVECLLSLKQSDKVIKIADAKIKKKPEDYAGWLWRAEACEQLKDYPRAISDYKHALSTLGAARKELSKTLTKELIDMVELGISGMIYRRLGACYERSNDYKQAALNYETSIRLMKPTLTASLNLKPDKAALATAQRSVTELSNALSQNPDDGNLYIMRAKAYKILGKHDQALADFEHVKKSDAPNVYYDRAGAYFAMGDFKSASRDLRKVHSEDPLYEMPHMRQKKYSLAVMPMANMKKSAVLHRFDGMIQQNPGEAENYYDRGALQMAFREYEEGANDLQQFLTREGTKRSVLVAKANIFLALCRGHAKRMNEYDAHLAKALDSTDSKWWQAIIKYLGEDGVTDVALLAAAQGNKAREVQARYYIGQRLAMKGFKAKAEEQFKAGIALDTPVDEYYLSKLALIPEAINDVGR